MNRVVSEGQSFHLFGVHNRHKKNES